MINNKNLLLQIEDLLDKLKGAAKFSKINLHSNNYQFRIKEGTLSKKTSKIRYGYYETFIKLIRLIDVVASCMDIMNRAFEDFLNEFFIVFINDLSVYLGSRERRWEASKDFSINIKERSLYAKFFKSEYWLDKVHNLGRVIMQQENFIDTTRFEVVSK